MSWHTTLNVGCGLDRDDSHVSVDLNSSVYPHIVCTIYVLPFLENQFRRVICHHVLEHLENPVQALDELCRVGKIVDVRVPILRWKHPDHKWHLTSKFFNAYAQVRGLKIAGGYRIDPDRLKI